MFLVQRIGWPGDVKATKPFMSWHFLSWKNPQMYSVIELDSKCPDCEWQYLPLEGKHLSPTVGAADVRLPSGGKSQQEFWKILCGSNRWTYSIFEVVSKFWWTALESEWQFFSIGRKAHVFQVHMICYPGQAKVSGDLSVLAHFATNPWTYSVLEVGC